MIRYARGMWDFQLAMFNYTRRVNHLAATPATIPFNSNKFTFKDIAVPINQAWYDFVQQVNPRESRRFITAAHTGWVNQEWTAGVEFPKAERIVMAGNALRVIDIVDEFAQIEAYDFYRDSPSPQTDTYETVPWKVHKFTVIANGNAIRNPGAGLDAYYPVFRTGKEMWISLGRIELFPLLPTPVRIEVPTIVHKPFGVATERRLAAGDVRELIDYRLTGSSVWGAVEEGWIPLLLNGVYSPTDWRMKTPPPLAPKPPAVTLPPEPAPGWGEYDIAVSAIRIIVRQTPAGNKVGEMVYGRTAHVYAEALYQGKPWLKIGEKRWISRDGTRRLTPAAG